MKKVLMATVVLALALPAFAQKGAVVPRSANSTDQAFLLNTAKAGLAEVELGKLALQNASSDQVKKFAQRMVDDHSKANDELRNLAASKNVILPSALDVQDKAMHDKLMALMGEDFDREYMAMMVAGHGRVADALRAEAETGKDADIKAWASKTLPTVEYHIKLAQETNSVVGSR